VTQFHPALDAALSADVVTIFGALRIELPGTTLRLLDGSAEIDLPEDGGTETYTGEDADYGTWESFDEFSDGSGDEAPGMSLTLLPNSDEAAATLSDPLVQGSVVVVSLAAREDSTGLLIGEPYPLLIGEIDVPVHKMGATLGVEYEVVGGMERLFFNDEGIRLSQAFHEQVWPGELGFVHVTGVTENDYWGVVGKQGSGVIQGGGGGGNGGGYGFGGGGGGQIFNVEYS
jgi:hypothetical protein